MPQVSSITLKSGRFIHPEKFRDIDDVVHYMTRDPNGQRLTHVILELEDGNVRILERTDEGIQVRIPYIEFITNRAQAWLQQRLSRLLPIVTR